MTGPGWRVYAHSFAPAGFAWWVSGSRYRLASAEDCEESVLSEVRPAPGMIKETDHRLVEISGTTYRLYCHLSEAFSFVERFWGLNDE